MLDFVDIQYAQHLAARLENFKIRSTNPYKINFRCPICGDSQKSRSKARGWLLEKDNALFYYCHNCGASQSFSYFLKGQDPMAYNQWVAEKFIKKANSAPTDTRSILDKTRFEAPKFTKKNNPLKSIKKVSQLQWNHPVKKYIQDRQIPPNQHYRLYYVNKFKGWINTIIPNKFENVGKDEPRLVIPFFDKDKNVFGVSARGFDPNGIRYITIMFDERPKIFGLDTVDLVDSTTWLKVLSIAFSYATPLQWQGRRATRTPCKTLKKRLSSFLMQNLVIKRFINAWKKSLNKVIKFVFGLVMCQAKTLMKWY